MNNVSCVLSFIWGQNRNCSLGDSTSDGSERLLQRHRGESKIYKILVKGDFNAIKCLLYKRLSATQRADVTMKGFSAFLDMRRFKDWHHEIGIMKLIS